jgi:hypothetical protein
MKHCPQCNASYDDGVQFCAKDGRSLQFTTTTPSRLCPHCANSIGVSASQCPYCKADTTVEAAPEWLIRDEPSSQPRSVPKATITTSRIVLVAAIAVCLFVAILWGAGFDFTPGDTSAATGRLLDEKVKELQAKDEQLKTLEAELARARQELAMSTKNGDALRLELDESQKAREAAEVRVSALTRELGRRNTPPARLEPRTEQRQPELASRSQISGRSAEPRMFETTRATEVYEQPAESSRVLSRVDKGTRINVVRANGDWLEVTSRRGNPPGFVLRNDAAPVIASN